MLKHSRIEMKYYSQYRSHDLFELQESLSGLSKSNRWVKLADHLPWGRIEKEYNKRLRNSHNGAGNKPARMVVGALIVKHVEKLSDEKTIQAIQENPYMQYLLGLEKFTEKPVFVPELLVLVRQRFPPPSRHEDGHAHRKRSCPPPRLEEDVAVGGIAYLHGFSRPVLHGNKPVEIVVAEGFLWVVVSPA